MRWKKANKNRKKWYWHHRTIYAVTIHYLIKLSVKELLDYKSPLLERLKEKKIF